MTRSGPEGEKKKKDKKRAAGGEGKTVEIRRRVFGDRFTIAFLSFMLLSLHKGRGGGESGQRLHDEPNCFWVLDPECPRMVMAIERIIHF